MDYQMFKCVYSICGLQKVGCDWGIDSSAKEDRCGVCHGDGSTCKTVTDKFDEKQGSGMASNGWLHQLLFV